VQMCGDSHLMNFGAFATPERNIIFDINDFDETLPGPWEWDVKRLAASAAIAGLTAGFHKSDARDTAERCVASYREHLARYADLPAIQCWHAHIGVDDLVNLMSNAWKRRIRAEVAAEIASETSEHAFPGLANVTRRGARIKDV